MVPVKALTPTSGPVRIRLARLHAIGGVTTPPDTNPEGYLPPFGPTEIAAMLADGRAVTWESLQGADTVTTTTDGQGGTFRAFGVGQFQTIAARCPSGKYVIMNTGTYEVNQPDWGSVGAGAGAVRMPKQCAGIIGRNPPGKSWGNLLPTTQRTVIRVKPSTAPAVNVAPAWFQLGYSGSIRFDMANLHFEGTEQGFQTSGGTGVNPGSGNDGTSRKLFTNVYFWNQQPGCTMRDCFSTGWFGNNGAPPGETFGFEWYHSTGGKVSRVYADGRRANDSVIYGAVGFTFGNAIDCTLSDSWFHHNAFAGHVHFKTVRCHTFSMVLGDPADHVSNHVSVGRTKGDWLNHELTNGNEHTDLVLNCKSVGGADVAHITHSNGGNFVLTQWNTGATFTEITGNGTLKLVDPIWSNIIRGGRLGIETWVPYGGDPETIKPPNYPVVVRRSGALVPGVDWKYDSVGTWVTIQ
jgi:hypothetical protein